MSTVSEIINSTEATNNQASEVEETAVVTTVAATVTDATVTGIITEETEIKTEPVSVTGIASTQLAVTDVTSVSFNSTGNGFVTDVTFYDSSQQTTDRASTILSSTTFNTQTSTTSDSLYNTSQILFTNITSNSSVSTSRSVDSGVGIHKLCENCTTTVVVVPCVSAGVVLLVLLTSVLCFFRLRHKWRAKIQLERKKTDIWSMATYNNTIINENFNDFQLAPPTNREIRNSSGFSENSVQFYDPFTGDTPQAQFSSNQVVMRSNTLPPEEQFANSTLRRNTVSAPHELELSTKALKGMDSFGFNDNRYTLRGRSSTFTVGRKQNVDRHVLLSHEELLDDQSAGENIGAIYKTPTSNYHMTEL